MKNLSIQISTANGTGSLSANEILTRICFRSGWNVGSYNFFPSNIAGLPCLYNLRVGLEKDVSYSPLGDLLLALNPKTLHEDISSLKPSGVLVTDDKQDCSFNGKHLSLPLTEVLKKSSIAPKMKKFFKNILYVGLACEWMQVSPEIVESTLLDFLKQKNKEDLVPLNLEVLEWGRELAKENPLPFLSLENKTSKNSKNTKDSKEILMDGNRAMALGALSAGCQFLSWYPITPASSLAENFEKWANRYQKTQEGKNKFIVLQAEDELAAFHHVLGAGWAGLRAMTVTSGPGLSLMAEGAGLSYFAEVPSVLALVQRAGPSTGLPTRTAQGDLLSACFLSHGDTCHPVLIPGTVEECFSFTAQAFDLAEQVQSLVIVLTDLNLGMNLRKSESFKINEEALNRGKLHAKEDLDKVQFSRYKDEDQDGISHRVLPGTSHVKSGYFTRGSGHNAEAQYTEDPKEYASILDKLKRKWETLKTLVPEPCIDFNKKHSIAFVTFGANEQPLQEARDILKQKDVGTNFMRIRAYPFSTEVKTFLEKHSEIFIVEQNRDAQMKTLLSKEFPAESQKFRSILQYDGRPFFPENILNQFSRLQKELH